MGTVDWHKWAGIPINILLFLLSILFMYSISDARTWELRASLKSIGRKSVSYSSNSLVTRFELLYKKNGIIEAGKRYLEESKLAALLAGIRTSGAGETDRLFFTPALIFVNAINRLVGKSPVLGVDARFQENLLETAYFYERKRSYDRAISLYSKSLGYFSGSTRDQVYIYLHRGFCYSLTGNFALAQADFQKVQELDDSGDMAGTAGLLVSYNTKIQTLQKEVEDNPDNMQKVKDYFSAIAYQKVLNTLKRLDRAGFKKTSEFYFYRARALEETGQTNRAIADYQRIIRKEEDEELVKNSNRRLYLLGAFYKNDSQLVATAKENAEKHEDKSFIQEVAVIEKSVVEEPISAQDAEEIYEAAEAISLKGDTEEEKEIPEEPILEYEVISLNREKEIEETVEPVKKVEPEAKVAMVVEEKTLEKKEQEETLKESKIDLLKPDLSIIARKEILKRQKELDKIYTINGSKLIGIIYEEHKDKIKLMTAFGTIDVPRSVIQKITKVGSEEEIK